MRGAGEERRVTPAPDVRPSSGANHYERHPYGVVRTGSSEVSKLVTSRIGTRLCRMLYLDFGEHPFHALR